MSSNTSTGQWVGYIVGAVVGYFTGGTGWALVGNMMTGAGAGGAIGGMIDPPRGPTINGPRLGDLSVQTSSYGTFEPRGYGTFPVVGNVIWLEGNKLKEVVRKKKSGGKGGGGGSTVRTYSYFATFAVSLLDCRHTGPMAGVRRIWVGSKLWYDAGAEDLESVLASNQAAEKFKFYPGSATQEPDPRIQADRGVANTPAYRGLCYIVLYDLPLSDFGNSLLGAPVKVEVVSGSGNGVIVVMDKVPLAGTIFSPDSGAGFLPSFGTFRYGHTRSRFSATAYEMRIGREWSTLPSVDSVSPDAATTMRGLVSYDNEMWFAWQESTLPGATRFKSQSGRFYGLPHGGHAQFVSRSDDGRLLISCASSGINPQLLDHVFIVSDVGPDSESPAVLFDGGMPCPTNFRISTAGGRVFAYSIVDTTISVRLYTNSFSLERSFSVTVPAGDWLSVVAPDNSAALPIKALWHDDALCLLYRFASGQYRFGAFSEAGTLRAYTFSASDTEILGFDMLDFDQGILSGSRVIHWRRFDTGTVLLADIIRSECAMSGALSESDIDVSGISQMVRGYRVTQQGAIRGALLPLQTAWPFDVVQSGYQLRFVPRGSGPVAVVDSDDLDARPYGDQPGAEWAVSREMETQLPKKITVDFLDHGREYDIGSQIAERASAVSVVARDVSLAIVLTSDEAAQIAERLIGEAWMARTSAGPIKLPPTYGSLEPADVIELNTPEASYMLKVQQADYRADGCIDVRAYPDAPSVYVPAAVGEGGHAGGRPIVFDGPCVYALLDIPLIRSVDDEPGFPVAMAGYSSGWPGGIMFRSSDQGQTWSDIQAFTAPVTMGFSRDVLASGRIDVMDVVSSLQVDLVAGDLESIDRLTMYAGSNHFAVGAHDRWEIVAAQSCTLQSDGSYILRDFMRGLFGTEWARTTHAAGDSVVLLSDVDIAFAGAESSAINAPRLYRGITAGRSIDDDPGVEFSYSGVNLKPLSPIRLNGSRHPTTWDWTLIWMRRTRMPSIWGGSGGVDLGEASEAYEIEIYTSSAYTTVKRTLSTSTPTVQYTSAQQVADFGSNQATIYVRVYQISSIVGRGYPLQTTITR